MKTLRLRWLTRKRGLWGMAAAGLLLLVLGFHLAQAGAIAAGAIGLGFAAGRLWRVTPAACPAEQRHTDMLNPGTVNPVAQPDCPPGTEGAGLAGVVGRLMAQDRFALVMRPRIAAMLSTVQLEQTAVALEESMALVPEGFVRIQTLDHSGRQDPVVPGGQEFLRRAGSPAERLWVDAAFLDRFAVTNRQFAQFVAAGGYEQMELWEQEIWIAVLDFVDQTGLPGPRYWHDTRCGESDEELPVVGVCWYEAAAYARWAGRRLPTEAEWVKGASWPVESSGGGLLARRYPWGDQASEERVNLWGSGPGRPVPVHWYAAGQSVGGLRQLVGNVWEWTDSEFAAVPDDEQFSPHNLAAGLSPPGMSLKVVRGGAFDTYFEEQATCNFRSGDRPTARKPNIGFRLALSAGEVADALNRLVPATPELSLEGSLA